MHVVENMSFGDQNYLPRFIVNVSTSIILLHSQGKHYKMLLNKFTGQRESGNGQAM